MTNPVPIPPTQEEIDFQQELLVTHRRTLGVCLKRNAAIGGEAHAPPEVVHSINEARANIHRIKETLRGWNVKVEDHPDDEGTLVPSQKIKKGGSILVPFVLIAAIIGLIIFWQAYPFIHSIIMSEQQIARPLLSSTSTSTRNGTSTPSPQGIEETTKVIPTSILATIEPPPTQPPPTQPPPTQPPQQAIPTDRRTLENGFVYWVDSMQAPNQQWRIRGRMEITYYESFVKVSQDEGVFYIPWERIVYIGSQEIL